MAKVTGIASEVVRPPPKFAISDEEYLKVSAKKTIESIFNFLDEVSF